MSDKETYNKIVDYYRKHHKIPSYRELAKLLKVSADTAHRRVAQIVDEGLLHKNSDGSLMPLFNMIPYVGNITAGMPIEMDTIDELIHIDSWLFDYQDDLYMFRVMGDSMKDAGIVDGDFVFIAREKSYHDGDIVIAFIDSEWTLKTLRTKGEKRWLEAQNPDYPDIHPEESLQIGGKMISLIRKNINS